jgi:hypothetical protein
MKIALFATATAAVALLGGAAYAQDPAPKAPTPGSVTGDWNGAHSPSDEKQYKEKVVVPVGATPSETVAAPPVDTGVTASVPSTETTAAADVATPASTQAATVTTTTVTNGPVADTPENRAKYGQPMSRAGKRTAAKGN